MLSAAYSLHEQCAPGSFGIKEPRASAPVVAPAALPDCAVVVTPGLLFSTTGERLGKGKGFYDRAFSELYSVHPRREFYRVGLCFDIQIAAAVPAAAHDIRMTHVVSERRVISCV